VVLREDGTPHAGAGSLRRRLALLVLVAAAGRGTISRDKLLGLLWPESDAERARHALRQSLHALQRSLGTDVLFLGTDVLQLNPEVISSDVQDVEDAVAAGAHERVIALCKGPFLDGFFLGDAPEFERWAEGQRARYAALCTTSLEACAERATARGDHAAAAAWWRRLAAEQPLSARYALGMMRALVECGDSTGALQFASLHEALVRDELGVEPDAAVVELAARLRGGEAGAAAEGARPPGGRAASAVRLAAARGQARDRQREWVERALGDRFILEAGIAPGGVATPYPAFDRERRAPVEIHLLDPGLAAVADVDQLVARLERLTTLRHPRLVPLYEFGHVDGIVYYVVARPAGESLRELLSRERQLAVGDALVVADDVAAGLEHAHAAGVVHADLRPKHVFVAASPGRDGAAGECRAAVAGVGIADALAAATARDRTSSAIRIGSPAYQSPEQLVGDRHRDARSDIYSLGCILYEMLAGDVPFASSSRSHVASGKLTSAAAPLTAVRDTVTPALDAVVQRCIARSPSDRYRTASELRAALRAVGSAPEPTNGSFWNTDHTDQSV
jgi:serine/threonine-protein kinase